MSAVNLLSDGPITVSFVIPAWNEERHLARCLASLNNQRLPGWAQSIEAILVDNQSTDDTAKIAEELGAKVFTSPPGSASRARNTGAQKASGALIAFVDADCVLPNDWLEKCGRHFRDPTVVAVGANMRAPLPSAAWVERCWYAIAHAGGSHNWRQVRWLPAFNLLVRSDELKKVGGFDEQLVTCEDCELSYRLSERGSLVLDPEPAVAHLGESQTLWQLFRREAWRSHGNLRLAITRSGDWRNWISLLLPVASISGLVGAFVLGVVAATQYHALWPFVTLCLATFMLPFLVLTARMIKRRAISSLAPALVVFGVYLAARTVGLFILIPRLARAAN